MRSIKSVLCVLLCFGWLTSFSAQAAILKIYHIDVEQGSSTLLVAPGGKTMLIDAGRNGHGPRIKAVMQQAGTSRIDFFVLTHFHDDHYGGIDELAKDPAITIGKAYDRGDKDELDSVSLHETGYVNYDTTVGHNAEQLTRGKTIPLDPLMTVTCVASGGAVIGEVNPVSGTSENDESIALYIQLGDFRFFIGGDIEITTEGKIAARNLVLDVDLYEADHHGAETSSTQPLLDDLKPTAVIISNGNRADYMHPRLHTLDLLAHLTPKPKVFQTNKYLKGGKGGNVPDEFIADLETTDSDGTILTTVDTGTGHFSIKYRDEPHDFVIKSHGTSTTSTTTTVVIKSLLPDPTQGPDTTFEEVTVKNNSSTPIPMTGWFLKDNSSSTWSLTSLGTLAAGESKTIRRNGMAMNLNNNGDEVTLFGPGNVPVDKFTYNDTQPGVAVETGH